LVVAGVLCLHTPPPGTPDNPPVPPPPLVSARFGRMAEFSLVE
jgi:hypothetical protein